MSRRCAVRHLQSTVVALLVLATCFHPVSFLAPRIRSDAQRAFHRHSTFVRAATDTQEVVEETTEVESKLPELLQLAASGDETALASRLDELFADISPEDISDLQMKLGEDSGEKSAPRLVSIALQAAVEKRMTAAKQAIEELLGTKEGDVNIRIRKLVKQQESVLPLLIVLQLNMAEAQNAQDPDKLRVLMHVHTVINEELEKKVSRVRGLLNKLLRIEDVNIRNNLLRHHLTPMEVPGSASLDDDDFESPKLMAALVPPSRLAAAISQLVKDIDRQILAVVSKEDEARFETLDRVRQVAKQARLVIGEVYGEAEMHTFGADLTPAFTTLMAHKARQLESAQAQSVPEASEATPPTS